MNSSPTKVISSCVFQTIYLCVLYHIVHEEFDEDSEGDESLVVEVAPSHTLLKLAFKQKATKKNTVLMVVQHINIVYHFLLMFHASV